MPNVGGKKVYPGHHPETQKVSRPLNLGKGGKTGAKEMCHADGSGMYGGGPKPSGKGSGKKKGGMRGGY